MRRFILAGLIAALSAGCMDQGPVSGPGTMTATLRSPNGPEGAAVVTLVGEGLGSVTSIGTTEVFARAGVGTVRIVLIDQAGGTLAFQIAVADTTQPPGYVVEEVAGPDDALRADLTGYDLEIAR